MQKQSFAVLALVATAVCASAVQAAPGGGPRAMFGGGPGFGDPTIMLEHMADHLDLDAAQREAVQSILAAARPELEALRAQARANHEALQTLDSNDAAYSTQLNNIALSNGQLATDGTLLMTRIRTEVHAVLTDEQQERLERGKERMRKRFERHNRH